MAALVPERSVVMLDSAPVWPAMHVPETESREGFCSVEVAERLTEGGRFDRAQALARFRGFVRRNYVAPRALYIGDKRKSYLYGMPEVLVAAVLGRICDAGVSDSAVLLAAANTLNNQNVEDWPDGLPFLHASPTTRAWSPAAWLIDQFAAGVRGWTLDVATFHHPENSFRVRGRIRNEIVRGPDNEPAATRFLGVDGYQFRSSFSVPLDAVLAGIFAAGPKPGEAVH